MRPDLWAAIRAELDRSRFLLLMASPEAATSRWVEEETAHWLATKGMPAARRAASMSCCPGPWVVFDEATQSSAAIGVPGTMAAVARDAPLVLAGSGATEMLSLFRIESTRRGVAVRAWKTFGATQSSGTKARSLAPDGGTLFYSNYRWGTGRGHGTARTEAIDVQTGRSLWANGFEGTIVYGPDGTLIAQSDSEGTDVISAGTSERLLRLSGYATAFSPDGRMLLSELREAKGRPLPDRAVWRLTETLPIPSLSRTEKLPPSLRGKCRADPSVFRIMADRTRRRWNVHDWRRIDGPGRAGIPGVVVAVYPPAPRSRSFAWKGNRVRVQDYATDLVEEALPTEILARFPRRAASCGRVFASC